MLYLIQAEHIHLPSKIIRQLEEKNIKVKAYGFHEIFENQIKILIDGSLSDAEVVQKVLWSYNNGVWVDIQEWDEEE